VDLMSSALGSTTSSSVGQSNPNPSQSLQDVLEQRQVRALYQPLVDLYTGETVGYEALARGPVGSAFERPDVLFMEARRTRMEVELEWQCQRAALSGACDHGLSPGQALFMNVEPGAPLSDRPAFLRGLSERALAHFPIFVELTERALIDDPAQLLAAVARMRALGAGIALDDVGADPRSLALMPFLAPEVIKLDLRLVQENPSRQIAEIVHAVSAESERTGALVLAEGIESEEHRETALALGARYGQGWLFGRPAELGSPDVQVTHPIPRRQAPSLIEESSPFELVSQFRPTRRGTKRLLLALSLQIEAQAAELGSATVVLSTFQESEFFTARTAARYSRLAEKAALVGALGLGLPERPAPGVRGVALDLVDPLRGEWDVTVIAPHFAMAFVARELGDSGADMDRRFDFAVTYDRDLAIQAAGAMMRRLAAL
jgi:EAL domain-containing protein (putative c-di-GMP-specific phosphodiesterase class I)